MGKNFRLILCLGLWTICGISYGVPYPSFYEMLRHLCSGKGTHAMFSNAFGDVREQSELLNFKDLKLFGEKKKPLFVLPKGVLPEESYDLKEFLDYRKNFEERFCGFIWCNIDNLAVFNDFTLKKAVETRAEDLLIRNSEEIAELVKVCKVLLSEAFAKKLLTDALTEAFYESRMYGGTFFNVRLGARGINETTRILRLEAEYTHRRYPREGEVREHVFKARFRFGYGFGKDGFEKGLREVCLKFLRVDDLRFRLNRFGEGIIERFRLEPVAKSASKDIKGINLSEADEDAVPEGGGKWYFVRNFANGTGKNIVRERKITGKNADRKRPRSPDSRDEAFGGLQNGHKRKKEG